MKTLNALMVAGLLTVGSAAHAEKKPVICLSWAEVTMPVGGVDQKVAICSDGKRPVILTSITSVAFRAEDGSVVKAVVGYR